MQAGVSKTQIFFEFESDFILRSNFTKSIEFSSFMFLERIHNNKSCSAVQHGLAMDFVAALIIPLLQNVPIAVQAAAAYAVHLRAQLVLMLIQGKLKQVIDVFWVSRWHGPD